jgi:uncharacterized protein (TIGR00369 family)
MKDEGKFFGIEIPFAQQVGAHGVESGGGRAVATVEVRPELTNSRGNAHGGLLVTLLDITMGSAARSLDPETTAVITVSINTNFLLAARGRITFEARVLHAGRSLATCECDARNEAGELVAKSTGTFQVRRPE